MLYEHNHYLLIALIHHDYDVARTLIQNNIGITDVVPQTGGFAYSCHDAITLAIEVELYSDRRPCPLDILQSLLDKAPVPQALTRDIMWSAEKLDLVLSHPRTAHLAVSIGGMHLRWADKVHPDCYLVLLKHGYPLQVHLIMLYERRSKKEFDSIFNQIVGVRRLIPFIEGGVLPTDIMRHIKGFIY